MELWQQQLTVPDPLLMQRPITSLNDSAVFHLSGFGITAQLIATNVHEKHEHLSYRLRSTTDPKERAEFEGKT